MIIKRGILDKIIKAYPSVPPECGGILGWQNNIIQEYFHDDGFRDTSRAVYTPNVELLNRAIDSWANSGIQFCGIVHSHLPGERKLSQDDLDYIQAVLENTQNYSNRLYFPIYLPDQKELIPYVATRHNDVVSVSVESLSVVH